jgi:hypothetical protein
MQFEREPCHPIIDRPWEYEIVGFCYLRPDDWSEPYVDLTSQKGRIVRRLRFFSPQEIEIEKGFPGFTNGIHILDIRSRGLEKSGVLVDDFEASEGSVRFLAREVIDLDETH